jgi:UDP-N-acetylglucosamine--N-acetylmuramyl-(pentapeptide) pyrophosphoryl-undecaprenol N-acetylglucosamine transferase
MTSPAILIAGGGTGGHVFPALAVAEALVRMADVRVIFVGTERGLEASVIPARGYVLETLAVEPMKGGGLARALRGGAIAAAATVRSASLLSRHRPRVVLSVGGYAAGPLSLAAAAARVPVALLEPNAIMGLANRVLAPLCRRAYVAWPEAARYARRGAMRAYGVPLRDGFVPAPYVARGTSRVLVLGGSQGASALNERLPDAIGRLVRSMPGRDLEVMHQTGADRQAEVRAAYEREGVERAVVVPFVDDMPDAMRWADVIVGRSGASTVAEIGAIGRASVLVPFPFAADDHQAKNAAALVASGGALSIRQEAADGVRLARELALLLGDAPRRTAMAEAAARAGRPRAAVDIASDLLGIAGIAPRASTPPPLPSTPPAEDLPAGASPTYGERAKVRAFGDDRSKPLEGL